MVWIATFLILAAAVAAGVARHSYRGHQAMLRVGRSVPWQVPATTGFMVALTIAATLLGLVFAYLGTVVIR